METVQLRGSRAHREIALLRLVAQRLAGPRLANPAEAVGWMTAAQAQDLPGALTSIALRVDGGDRTVVTAALDRGEVVRGWPMRGTLHLTRAEDMPWLVGLLAGRVRDGAVKRREALGLDQPTLLRAERLAVEALAGGQRLTRAQLLAAWEAGGIAMTGPRGYHLLWYLAQSNLVCLGPTQGREQLVVRVDEWITRPRQPTREEALAQLARRYFHSHGPATRKDFIRWTGLTATDAKAGLAAAAPQLARLVVDDTEYFLDPRTPDLLAECRADAQRVRLLPGFDEFMLGYADRSAALPPPYADRIVPGGNGVFRPTVVDRGQIVGTWRSVGKGAGRRIEASPFETFPARVSGALDDLHAAPPWK